MSKYHAKSFIILGPIALTHLRNCHPFLSPLLPCHAQHSMSKYHAKELVRTAAAFAKADAASRDTVEALARAALKRGEEITWVKVGG